MRGRLLLERRSKMLRQIAQGVPLNETVNSLSIEYAVTENALYQDWKQRQRWVNDVVGLNNPDAFVTELIDFLKWLRTRSTYEILQGDSTSNRIGAIRTAVDVVKTLYGLAQSTGKVHYVKEKESVERDIIIQAWDLGESNSTVNTVDV